MSIQAYQLDVPGSPSNHGVVLVNSVTDQPFPMSVYTFTDLDDADAFVAWLVRVGFDLRQMPAEQVLARAEEWLTYGREAQRRHCEQAEAS